MCTDYHSALRCSKQACLESVLHIPEPHGKGSASIVNIIIILLVQDMSGCPGVRIEDMGHKMGCNGVDNGKLWFDGAHHWHVQTPYAARSLSLEQLSGFVLRHSKLELSAVSRQFCCWTEQSSSCNASCTWMHRCL